MERFVRREVNEPLWQLAVATLPGVFPFPAERKTLISIYKLLRETFTSLAPKAISQRSGLTSLPVQAFVAMLNELDLHSDVLPERSRGVVPGLAGLLEEKILKGTLSLPAGSVGSHPFFTPEGTFQTLPMHASASVVRALAGLDLYLKHLARAGDFLVIDEPEMNAHPGAQLAIMELLAMLVNAGLQITLTTHSPYIVDHLNNLIEAAKLPEDAQESVRPRFKLQNRDAFLHPDKVAVYHFGEDGQVRDVFDRELLTLDTSTFSQESNYLSELYGEILRAGAAPR